MKKHASLPRRTLLALVATATAAGAVVAALAAGGPAAGSRVAGSRSRTSASAVETRGVAGRPGARTAVVADPADARRAVVAGRAAPYIYYGWGRPQSPSAVIAATGLKQYTLAFMLATGTNKDATCSPAWNGSGALTGNAYSKAISEIRKGGGNVSVSFGGASGPKLGMVCSNASSLASAYEKVISTFSLTSIDLDIETNELPKAVDREKEIDALVKVHRADPQVYISVTFPTNPSGPDSNGKSLIADAAAAGFRPNAWTVMPFDFGEKITDMAKVSDQSVTGLAKDLAAAYEMPLATAYRMSGISTMNGYTDESNEIVSLANFQTMLSFTTEHHVARFTYWALNRDRPCKQGLGKGGDCSGISQKPYAFTKLLVGFH